MEQLAKLFNFDQWIVKIKIREIKINDLDKPFAFWLHKKSRSAPIYFVRSKL